MKQVPAGSNILRYEDYGGDLAIEFIRLVSGAIEINMTDRTTFSTEHYTFRFNQSQQIKIAKFIAWGRTV